MEEAVGAAKEAVRAMDLQHEAQWNASKERSDHPCHGRGRDGISLLRILVRELYTSPKNKLNMWGALHVQPNN